jgi:regulator of replication initiation timing
MKDVDPSESIAVTRRDYQELLTSFRQVVEERNALLCEVERLHSRPEDVPEHHPLHVQRRAG